MSAPPLHIFASDGTELVVRSDGLGGAGCFDTVLVYVGQANVASEPGRLTKDEAVALARQLLRHGLPEREALRLLRCLGEQPSQRRAEAELIADAYAGAIEDAEAEGGYDEAATRWAQ